MSVHRANQSSQDGTARFRSHMRTMAIVCLVGLVLGYVVFVLTPWGQRFDDLVLLGRSYEPRRLIKIEKHALERINLISVGLALVAIMVQGLVRGARRTGLVVLAAFSAAMVGAEVLKRVLPRPDLANDVEALLPDMEFDTYPSGHAAIASSMALALVLLVRRRYRPIAAVAGGLYVAFIVTGVVTAGWHRPSDALGGVLLAGLLFALSLSLWFKDEFADPVGATRLPIVLGGVALLTVGLTWLELLVADRSTDAPTTLHQFTIAQICLELCSFAVVGWCATQRSQVGQRDLDRSSEPLQQEV